MKFKLKRKPTVSIETPQAEVIDTSTSSIDRVMEQALSIHNRCKDFHVTSADPSTMQIYEGSSGSLHLQYIPDGGARRSSVLRGFALSQFGTKIGVPASYLEKCISKGRSDIAEYNVNAWLKDYSKPLFIREYQEVSGEDTIRGVLSNRYAICDTPEIIDGISRVIDMNEFRLKGSYVSPERFHMRIASKERMPVEGEDLFAGISIDSSDVGKSTLKVNFLVFKQICTNGLIVNRGSTQLFRQKHIGVTASAFRQGLESGIDLFPRIAAKVVDCIEKTRNSEAPFDFDYEDDEQLADLVTSIRKQQAVLSEEHATNVISIMRSGRYERNRWGYINALTEVAQRLPLDKRLILEENAGRLLAA